jgi:peptidoglycan/xylan/chitin deacetylase (PgdA/CDA1 family)
VDDCRDDPYRVTVTPRRFERHLRWLADRGLRGVGIAELLRAQAAGEARRLVGLTFDDGYDDFRRNALPLLVAHGHRATVFVLPGRLGGDNVWDALGPRKRLLDAAGVREVAASGMEIGSHGLFHRDLTALPPAALAAEARDSRSRLEDLTGTSPAGFCYPYGAVDAAARRAVRDAGYEYACAVDPGASAGAYALPRTYAGQADTGPRLRAKRWRHRARRFVLHDPPRAAPLPRPARETPDLPLLPGGDT